MGRTPDRSPGAMIEDEEIRFVSNSNGPTVAGAFNYNGTEFVMRDAMGTFNPRSSASAFTTSGSRIETAFTASFPAGLSGSLTQLTDGSSYLVAGANVTIATASNGQVTISAIGGGGSGGGDTFWQSSQQGRIFTTGSALIGGHVTASLGFSGSLTRLADGTAYLRAGSNVTVTSESNGPITISTSLPGPRRTYHVSALGSDVTGSGSILAPFASINAAILAIGGGSSSGVPFSISVEPGFYNEPALTIPPYTEIVGQGNPRISAPQVVMKDVTEVNSVTINSPQIYAGDNNSVSTRNFFNNVTLDQSTSIITQNVNTVVNITNMVGKSPVQYTGPAGGGSIISDKGSTYEQIVNITNVNNYNSSANAYLTLNIDSSTTNFVGSSFSGPVTASNGSGLSVAGSKMGGIIASASSVAIGNSTVQGSVNATGGSVNISGSPITGGVTGSSNAGIQLSTDSYPRAGLALFGGATFASLSEASGDLSGSYPAPEVVRVRGRSVSQAVPSSNQVLMWSAVSSSWGPSSVDLTGVNTALTGVLPVSRGGTGLTSAPTSGQLLIGSGSGYTLSTLTAGTGIVITNGSGSITVSAPNTIGVNTVTASTPLSSSGGANPNISLGTVGVLNGGTGLSALPASGQVPVGNGTGFTLATLTAGQGITVTNSAGSISLSANGNAPQSIVLNDTSTGATPKVLGSVYFVSARTLSASSTAFMGGSLVGDVSRLQLVPEGGGSAIATWQKTGTLGSQVLTSGGTVSAAGWYDLVLQGTSGSGVAFCKGLYLI